MKAQGLATDLENMVFSYIDHVDIDVTPEIDRMFGTELLIGIRQLLTEKDRSLTSHVQFVFHPSYPEAFLRSIVIDDGGGGDGKHCERKLDLHNKSRVSKDFVRKHGKLAANITHPSIPLSEFKKADFDDHRRILFQRDSIDPDWFLEHYIGDKRYNDSWLGLWLSNHNVELTDDFVRHYKHLFKRYQRELAFHPGLSPALLSSVSGDYINYMALHPRFKEMLDNPRVLANFIKLPYPRITRLGWWFFEQNPSELEPDRIRCYFSKNQIESCSPELICNARRYKHLIPDWHHVVNNPHAGEDIVGEVLRECKQSGRKVELRDRRYFLNDQLSMDFYIEHHDIVPLDYEALSCRNDLPIRFIVENKDKLNLRSLLTYNFTLAQHLMSLALRREVRKVRV